VSRKSSLLMSPTKTMGDRRGGPPPVTQLSKDTLSALEELECVRSWEEFVTLCEDQQRQRQRRPVTPWHSGGTTSWSDESAGNSAED